MATNTPPGGLATLVKSKAALATLAAVVVGGAGATVAAANGAFG